MAKNFKIADIKAESRYTVATVDKWDGTAKAEEMTGAQLVAFANAAAHLYDIRAEEIAEPAQYMRMQEEIAQTVESLKDQLKQHMTAAGVDALSGTEHKATYKAVASSRIDTAALKKDMPELAQKYTKTTETRRFLFA